MLWSMGFCIAGQWANSPQWWSGIGQWRLRPHRPLCSPVGCGACRRCFECNPWSCLLGVSMWPMTKKGGYVWAIYSLALFATLETLTDPRLHFQHNVSSINPLGGSNKMHVCYEKDMFCFIPESPCVVLAHLWDRWRCVTGTQRCCGTTGVWMIRVACFWGAGVPHCPWCSSPADVIRPPPNRTPGVRLFLVLLPIRASGRNSEPFGPGFSARRGHVSAEEGAGAA